MVKTESEIMKERQKFIHEKFLPILSDCPTYLNPLIKETLGVDLNTDDNLYKSLKKFQQKTVFSNQMYLN